MSLSSFTIDEVNALQNGGGNAAFERTYCASLPRDYVKPKSTSHDLVKSWIEDVYVLKKFYKDVKHVERPPSLDVSSQVVTVPLSDILGADTPILQVHLEKKEEKVKEGIKDDTEDRPVENLLGDWDPFDAQVLPPEAPIEPSLLLTEDQSKNEPVQEDTPAIEAVVTFEEEWQSFMSDSIAPSSDMQRPSVENDPAAEDEQEDPASSTEATSKEDTKSSTAVVKDEIPLEAFYPEFEQIRATGILPTGQPVPWNRPRPPDVEQRPPPIAAPSRDILVDPPQLRMPPRPAPANPTDRAITALYGKEKNLTAYNLTAPQAPRPATSGNPFA